MNAFRFRLETLLRLRRAALDEQRAKLADAYRADELLRQHMGGMEDQIAANRSERRRAVHRGAVDIDGALAAQRFDMILQSRLRELARQREAVSAAIEKQRQVVIEADREVKVIERLRERRLAEHRAAEQIEDVKSMDEAAARSRREAP
jgi:flagellar FliJ protein